MAVDQDDFYGGRVFGETDSHVSLHMEDGVITGSIHLPDEVYHVEVSPWVLNEAYYFKNFFYSLPGDICLI